MSILTDAVQAVQKKAIQLAPDSWIPGSRPDPLIVEKHGLIGAPISRLDGPLKVRGAARFAAEFPLEHMTHAAIVYSTIAKGRIASIETREAETAAGLVLIMTHHNAPRLKPMPGFGTASKASGGDTLPIMQDDQIHWNGQPVAVVLAETVRAAAHAASRLRVAYEPLPATNSVAAANAAGTASSAAAASPNSAWRWPPTATASSKP